MENRRNNWLKNYFHLLEECCNYGMTNRKEYGDFDVYHSSKSAWPNLAVLKNDFRRRDLDALNLNHHPVTLLLPNKMITEGDLDRLLQEYPRQGKWFEMQKKISNSDSYIMENFDGIKEVRSKVDFERWLVLVETTLMAGQRFDKDSLWSLLQGKVVNLILGLYKNKEVAAAMYHVFEDTVGVYFVVTLPEYRRNGLGALLTQYILKRGEALKLNFCVLQATDMGRKVYDKYGFTSIGDVNVFFTLKNK